MVDNFATTEKTTWSEDLATSLLTTSQPASHSHKKPHHHYSKYIWFKILLIVFGAWVLISDFAFRYNEYLLQGTTISKTTMSISTTSSGKGERYNITATASAATTSKARASSVLTTSVSLSSEEQAIAGDGVVHKKNGIQDDINRQQQDHEENGVPSTAQHDKQAEQVHKVEKQPIEKSNSDFNATAIDVTVIAAAMNETETYRNTTNDTVRGDKGDSQSEMDAKEKAEQVEEVKTEFVEKVDDDSNNTTIADAVKATNETETREERNVTASGNANDSQNKVDADKNVGQLLEGVENQLLKKADNSSNATTSVALRNETEIKKDNADESASNSTGVKQGTVNATTLSKTTTSVTKPAGKPPNTMKFNFMDDQSARKLEDGAAILQPYCDVKKDDWCVVPEPIQGKWIPRENQDGTKHKHIVDLCCSSNPNIVKAGENPPQCKAKSMARKYHDWVYPKPTIPVPFHTRDTINSCQNSWKGTFTDPYVWQSSVYNLTIKENFDAHKVCEYIGKRKVFLIGDSQMKQLASTLSNALLPLDSIHGGNSSCRSQITSGVVDTLTGVKYGRMNRGGHFVKVIDKFKPDIVIMGTGAHIYGEDNYKLVIDEVLKDIEMLRQNYTDIKFIWKTMSPGGCTRLDELQPLIEKGYTPDDFGKRIKFKKHNWDTFYGRDLYTIIKMRQHNIPVMDLRMMYSRSDAHIDNPRDCLHSASPGPYDVVPMIFQHLLENGL